MQIEPKAPTLKMRQRAFSLLLSLGFVCGIMPLSSQAADPCDPATRQICGRLVISMVGAGEVPNYPGHPTDTTVENDQHSLNASGHFLQFTGVEDSRTPFKYIMITSDPGLKEWTKKLPFRDRISLAGVVDNSIPSFTKMLDPSNHGSALNRALDGFKREKSCRKLLGSSDDVTSYLNVDIIIDGELVQDSESPTSIPQYGVSSFKNEGTVGTIERWQKDGTVIGKKEIASLIKCLPGALVQVFLKTCKSGHVGKLFDQAAQDIGICGCFLGITDEVQNNLSGGLTQRPTFNYAMQDGGASYEHSSSRSPFGRWAGDSKSVYSMIPTTLDQNKNYYMHPLNPEDPASEGIASLIIEHRNPLFGFGYTSTDAITNSILKQLAELPKATVPAKQIADAEFASEIPSLDTSERSRNGLSQSGQVSLSRIEKLLEVQKQQVGAYIDTSAKTHINQSVFNQGITKFNNCLKATSDAPDVCRNLRTMIAGIERKGEDKTDLTDREIAFTASFVRLTAPLAAMKLSRQLADYVDEKESLHDFLSRMSLAERLLIQYKRETRETFGAKSNDRVAKKEQENLENQRKAIAYMNEALDEAFASAKAETFNQLRKDSITTKLERTRLAIELLAQNASSMPYADSLLAEMATKMALERPRPKSFSAKSWTQNPQPRARGQRRAERH